MCYLPWTILHKLLRWVWDQITRTKPVFQMPLIDVCLLVTHACNDSLLAGCTFLNRLVGNRNWTCGPYFVAAATGNRRHKPVRLVLSAVCVWRYVYFPACGSKGHKMLGAAPTESMSWVLKKQTQNTLSIMHTTHNYGCSTFEHGHNL
jgi:hypothetical protein